MCRTDKIPHPGLSGPRGSAEGRLRRVHDIDPAFTALPLRALADAALSRARELGAEHADFRLERIRSQTLRLHDAALETALDADDVGLSVRVVKDGTWGFAAGIDLTPDGAARVAAQAVEVAGVARAVNREPIELAPEPVHGERTWISAYDIDPFDVPTADKIALLAGWSRPAARRRPRRPRGRDAPAGQGEQVLRRPRRDRHHPAAGPPAPGRERRRHRRRPVRHDADARAARRVRVGVAVRRALGLGRRARPRPGAARREARGAVGRPRGVRRRRRPVQPVADDPRVDRARHRAGPGARLRGRLRGHLVRHARQARGAAVRVEGHEHHRGPDGRARPVHHRLRRRGRADAVVRHRLRGLFTGYQTDRRIARLTGAERSNGCAFADAPSSMPIQRMANVSLKPPRAARPPTS